MSLKQYFAILTGGMILAWSSFILLLLKTNPENSTTLTFALWYGSLFLGLTGIFSLIGTAVRIGILHKHDAPIRQVVVGTRQAALLSLLIVLALWLQSRQMLEWWSLLLMVFLITLLELVLISLRFKR